MEGRPWGNGSVCRPLLKGVHGHSVSNEIDGCYLTAQHPLEKTSFPSLFGAHGALSHGAHPQYDRVDR